MRVTNITQQQAWDRIVEKAKPLSFLQHFAWGEVQKELGYKVLRLAIVKENNPLAIAQTILISAKRGRFIFVPHGPLFLKETLSQPQRLKILKFLKNYLVKFGKENGYSFIRFAPLLEDRVEERKIFKNLGFREAPIYMHAETFWIKALDKDEDSLLKEMRKTTRNLIRKALRTKELKIEKRTDPKALDDFWKIYIHTAKTQKFTPFSKKFIKIEFGKFQPNSLFLFAKYKGEILAAALILFTKQAGYYHQGASIHSKIPATYLLQWKAMLETKKRGCKYYNFWGIYRERRAPVSWKGLSFFKQGFGGFSLNLLPTQDYILSPKYYLTWAYEKFLGWRRGVR